LTKGPFSDITSLACLILEEWRIMKAVQRVWIGAWLVVFPLLLLPACSTSPAGRDRRATSAGEPTPIPTAVPIQRPVYRVEQGEVVYAQDISGRITAVVEADLSFDLDGQVAQVFVARDDDVETGELLAQLDTSLLENELLRARSAVEIARTRLETVENELATRRRRAELNLALAQLDLDFAVGQAGDEPTAEELYQVERLAIQRDLAQLALDELSGTVDPQLRADLLQAQLQVEELEAAIASSSLVAPFAGRLLALNLSPGRAISAGQRVAVIADLGQLEASATLQPQYLEELVEGMPVTIAPAGRPGEEMTGTIRQLPYPGRESGGEDPDTTVRIAFDDPADALSFQVGDRVRVHVVVEQRAGVLWLPPAAVRDFGGRNFVIVEDGRGQSRVDVVLGLEGDGRVEIREGLVEGQTVIGP
jgi:multidrug efflux pump subunit AcrA (membrane-fusion protein)